MDKNQEDRFLFYFQKFVHLDLEQPITKTKMKIHRDLFYMKLFTDDELNELGDDEDLLHQLSVALSICYADPAPIHEDEITKQFEKFKMNITLESLKRKGIMKVEGHNGHIFSSDSKVCLAENVRITETNDNLVVTVIKESL